MIAVPTRCHHRKLSPTGARRLCVIKLKGQTGLVAASTVDVIIRDALQRYLETTSGIEAIRWIENIYGGKGRKNNDSKGFVI